MKDKRAYKPFRNPSPRTSNIRINIQKSKSQTHHRFKKKKKINSKGKLVAIRPRSESKMAFLPPSTFPLYLRFYEHGHAVTFIRQRLMSRSAVKYYLTIRPLFFPPFSSLLPSPNERRLRLCFPDQDNRNRIEHGSYLAALYRLRSSNFFFFFFFFFVSVSATEKIISASTSTRRIPPY